MRRTSLHPLPHPLQGFASRSSYLNIATKRFRTFSSVNGGDWAADWDDDDDDDDVVVVVVAAAAADAADVDGDDVDGPGYVSERA